MFFGKIRRGWMGNTTWGESQRSTRRLQFPRAAFENIPRGVIPRGM